MNRNQSWKLKKYLRMGNQEAFSLVSPKFVGFLSLYLFLATPFFQVATDSNVEQCSSGLSRNSNNEKGMEEVSRGSCSSGAAIAEKNGEGIEEYNWDADLQETGLEFIDNSSFKLDAELYLGENTFASYNLFETPLLDIVRMFIRDLKGLPRDKMLKSSIGSGENEGNRKPPWAFLPYRLKKLAKIEIDIYNILKSFYANKEDSPSIVKSYFKDIEASSLRAVSLLKSSKIKSVGINEDPYLYIGSHPLLIYRMIRRFAKDLQPILSQIENEGEDDLIDLIYANANPDLEIFPEEDDLIDALESIERIQKEAGIKTDELARGKLENVDTRLTVNSLQALEIGAFLMSKGKYDLAVEWVYLAFESISTSPTAHEHPGIQQFFLNVLEFSINEHNRQHPEKVNEQWSPGVFATLVESGELDVSSTKRLFDSLKEEAAEQRDVNQWNWAIPINFAQACAGISLLTEKEKANLKCLYFRDKNPYWLINPLKMELLRKEPTVVQIYDFIGDALAKKIKDTAVDKLKRSTVVDKESASKQKVEDTRTSSQTWLYDSERSGDFMKGLTRRLELLSGLIIMPKQASDAYQVATYGPSHHYAPHIDSFENPGRTEVKGNRIATLMGYINEVHAGGRTGFPVLGIFTEPVKGSIVMWENLENDAESRDMRTWHGGCPVLLGVKWIVNKWVYSRENMFTYLCKN